jgi:hypothetical protein
LALHEVHFDSAKDLWYCDVQVDVSAGSGPSRALPFIRLGIASYQEHGLPGQRLSPVTVCEMYKLLGRRELEVVRHSERRFTVRLNGEFDVPPEGSIFPQREVVVRLEARAPDLSPDVVHYAPPGTPKGSSAVAADHLHEYKLSYDSRRSAYLATFEITPELWRSASAFNGKESLAVVSVVEFEIFPTSESQSDSTGTDILMIGNRLAARRLVYSSSFQLTHREAKS